MNPIHYQPDSDKLSDLIFGAVNAGRINDVMADPRSKRYVNYLNLVHDQFVGEPAVDHCDQYREQAKTLVPMALMAYERRHGVHVTQNVLFQHPDNQFHIVALPDAIEGESFGITVHVRQSEETYEKAIERGIDEAMLRRASAMMAITGYADWLELDYWQGDEQRRLYEHWITRKESIARKCEDAMIEFLAKTRMKSTA